MESPIKILWKLFHYGKKTKTFFGLSIIPNIITEKWGYNIQAGNEKKSSILSRKWAGCLLSTYDAKLQLSTNIAI